jgi:hypothetical protein
MRVVTSRSGNDTGSLQHSTLSATTSTRRFELCSKDIYPPFTNFYFMFAVGKGRRSRLKRDRLCSEKTYAWPNYCSKTGYRTFREVIIGENKTHHAANPAKSRAMLLGCFPKCSHEVTFGTHLTSLRPLLDAIYPPLSSLKSPLPPPSLSVSISLSLFLNPPGPKHYIAWCNFLCEIETTSPFFMVYGNRGNNLAFSA